MPDGFLVKNGKSAVISPIEIPRLLRKHNAQHIKKGEGEIFIWASDIGRIFYNISPCL